MDQQLPGLAVHRQVHQDVLVRRVEVPDVVRDRLEVPLQLAGVGAERDDAVRVQVGAPPVAAVEVGRGVAGAPVDQVQLRVVRAGHPGGAPAVAPTVAGPRLVARLAGARNDVKPPALLAGVGIERHDVAAVGQVAPARADHDDVVDQQRRRAHEAAPLGAVLHQRAPRFLARLDVDGHHVVVVRAEVQVAVAQRQPAHRLDRAPPVARMRRGVLVDVAPDLASGRGVEGVDAVPGGGEVHDAVRHERRALQAVLHHAGLERPGRLQAVHVAGVDLVERAVAHRTVGAAVDEPVLRLVVGVAQAVQRDLTERRGPGNQQQRRARGGQRRASRYGADDRHVLSSSHVPRRPRGSLTRAGRRRTASGRRRWPRTAGRRPRR